MWWHMSMRRRCKPNLSFFTFHLHHYHFNSTFPKPKQFHFPQHITAFIINNLTSTPAAWSCHCDFSMCFSSSNFVKTRAFPTTIKPGPEDTTSEGEGECEGSEENDEDNEIARLNVGVDGDERLIRDVNTIMDALRELRKTTDSLSSHVVKSNKLDQCCGGVAVSSDLVVQVLSRLNSDWEAAFTFFLWAAASSQKHKQQPDYYVHSLREYHAMIYILGKARKFDIAWSLIDEMRGRRTGGSSLVTPHTLLIMIRRYSAVHNVGKAMSTFYAHKRFGFDVGVEEFQSLLCALCRYKNVEDAEHLLYCNKNIFPFNTKSFNIVLNGWCNVIASPREAERFWMKMSKRGIPRDVFSFASIISCYSKANNLYKVLRLFDQMKEMNISPDRKVYNAVIYALAKARHVKEALNLIQKMDERDINPNTVTYNSLIKPLCKARKIDEAREVFDDMLLRGLSPTVQTYHAFFRILRTGQEVFMLLEKMNLMGCHPNIDTYIMLIRKFCRWRQLDNVFKVWKLMSESGICPDRSSYIVLIHGLFLNGKLEEAYKYYIEMKEKQLIPEPKIDEKLQAWMSGKQIPNSRMIDLKDKMKEKQLISEPSIDDKLKTGVSGRQILNSGMIDVKDSQAECSQFGKKSRVTLNKFTQESAFRRQPENRQVVRERGFSFWE